MSEFLYSINSYGCPGKMMSAAGVCWLRSAPIKIKVTSALMTPRRLSMASTSAGDEVTRDASLPGGTRSANVNLINRNSDQLRET